MSDDNATWTTREGAVLPIRQMTTRHLLATIHFIERKRMENLLDLGMINEAVIVTDGSDGVDEDVIAYYAAWPESYGALLDEAERRHLIGRGSKAPKLEAPKGRRR